MWEGADLGRDTLIRRFFSCLLRAQQHFRSSAKVLTCCGLISQLTLTLTYKKKTKKTHTTTHTRSAQLGSCYNKRVVGSRHQKFQRRSAVCCAQLTCQAQRWHGVHRLLGAYFDKNAKSLAAIFSFCIHI